MYEVVTFDTETIRLILVLKHYVPHADVSPIQVLLNPNNNVFSDLPLDALKFHETLGGQFLQFTSYCRISTVSQVAHNVFMFRLPSSRYGILWTKNYEHILGFIHNEATQTKFFCSASTFTHTHNETRRATDVALKTNKSEAGRGIKFWLLPPGSNKELYSLYKYETRFFLAINRFYTMKGSGILYGRRIECKQREWYTFLKLLQFVFQIYKHSIPFVLNTQQLLEHN